MRLDSNPNHPGTPNALLPLCHKPLSVELWGILDGLLILLSKGYRQATIQTDNLDVVQTLNDIGLEDSGITLFRRLRQIMRIKRHWQIRHVPREHNSITNRLTKFSLTWKSNLQVFDVAPIEVLEILDN
ncbi:hypothetical protein PVK06_021255 [Gossypium arboreum]|uniref:RNase H type-1 domain-containing protein n=1 Tax=Gossypium arboreum TaxID=29729 RepID=A0ABR0PPI9_GOSAR|nr:hypothetical protein PVK06_021255 [Gossypium arboreum]